MNPELAAVVYGMVSGISWGAADFGGGFVSRKVRVYSVMFTSQSFEIGLFILLGLIAQESAPPLENVFWASMLGIFGMMGGIALYRGLSEGSMGVVAPVSALATGGVPVIFSLLTEGLPSTQQALGLAFAPIAIWLLSSSGTGFALRWRDIRFGLGAGVGFGLGFIFVDQMQPGHTFFSLLFGRLTSAIIMFTLISLTSQREIPARRFLPIIALIAAFNVGGVSLFALATENGRLDISSVLASLYPAVTVLLAWVVLHERLNSRQWMGVLAASIAIILIAG